MADGHGGARKGAGRKPGQPSRSHRAAEAGVVRDVVTKRRRATLPDEPVVLDPIVAIDGVAVKRFEGDAIDFFQSVYRNETYPIGIRLTAARCASNFERPSLHAIASLQATQEPPSINVNFTAAQPRPADEPRRPVTLDVTPEPANVVALRRFVR